MNTKNRFFIDIHVLQTVPPSCVNRDDTGSPKTAVYGGTSRARVSSQSWKHAIREYFKNDIENSNCGSRTKYLPSLVADEIRKMSSDIDEEKAIKLGMKALKNAGIKTDEKSLQNSALFFISKSQIKALAELVLENVEDKKEYQNALKSNPAFDIILFGRMVADDPSLNYDAAAQVAHAISTHEVHTEYDYFTAVDDEQKSDNAGAGHLGTIEYNSSTLYRYATLNVTELYKWLQEDTPEVAADFLKAFVYSMPTGKQNTFANRTLPDMIYVTVRSDQPVNLSGAFEKAVRADKKGYASESCERLLSYAEETYSMFCDKPELALGCGHSEKLSDCAEVMPFDKLYEKLRCYIADNCGKEQQ